MRGKKSVDVSGIKKLIDRRLNDLSINKKLLLVYIVCMFIPLILTDGVVLGVLNRNERREADYEMENVANSVRYIVGSSFDEAITVINKLYLNEEVYAFLDKDFESDYDFFTDRVEIKNNILKPLDGGRESSIIGINLCSDNDTIINGGNFYNMDRISDLDWMDLSEAKSKIVVNFYYDVDVNQGTLNRKKVSLMRVLDHYRWYDRNMLVYVELDHSVLQRKMKALAYTDPVYLCEGDKVLLSNTTQTSVQMDYDDLDEDIKIGLDVPWNIYGKDLRIVVARKQAGIAKVIKDNALVLLILIAFNLIAPVLVIRLINRSFAVRLYDLSKAFDEADIDNIRGIDTESAGDDEIGLLMRGYNRMVERLNSLIRTNYTVRLERQEIELARQNAELSALHSQINPHFLFNILESIRMRSVLKGEQETAGMIEKMATLVRQNISWSTDNSTILEELDFIRAYLELQQYRFGERLRFNIEAEDGCADYSIPRLTLTTFVENACVHGMEGKTSLCWVYVRVYRKAGDDGDLLIMEIEDTGRGMSDEDVEYLNDRMNNCTIDDIKDGSHVGMLNACLRLKLYTEDEAGFEIESEKEVGTYITISVPIRRLKSDA